jgi:nucleoside-diphosphate-sugar epimerase
MSDLIVVCGAGGFVGRRLVQHLAERGHEVRAVTRQTHDLQDPAQCRAAIAGARWVFNLAAKVGGIDFISRNKASCMMSARINLNLLEAAASQDTARYFFSSSSCVYPDGIEYLKESDAYPADPIAGYGWEKIFSERACLAFQEQYRLSVSIARYHGLYGPGDIREQERDHVIAALCRKVAEAKLSGRHEITIWGDGNQTRSFLYIDDCLHGTSKMVFDGVTGPVNMANARCVSINELVGLLEDIAAVKLTRFYNSAASTGRQHKCSDNTLIRELMNWEPMTPIRTGLERTYRACWDSLIKQ